MIQGPKILGPIAQQDGTVKLRIAADKSIVAGVEGAAFGIQPCFLGPEMPAPEDRCRIAGFGAVDQPFTPFKDQDTPSRRSKGSSQRGAPHAGTDDDDIRIHQGAILPSVAGSKATAFSMFTANS